MDSGVAVGSEVVVGTDVVSSVGIGVISGVGVAESVGITVASGSGVLVSTGVGPGVKSVCAKTVMGADRELSRRAKVETIAITLRQIFICFSVTNSEYTPELIQVKFLKIYLFSNKLDDNGGN